MAQLKELVDIYLGVTHTPEYVENGVPFLSVKDISGGKICFDDCKYISEEEYNGLSQGAKPQVGDMLFCRVGTIGKPIIIPEGTPLFGSFVSLGYLRNRNANKCNLEYLRYWMYSKAFERQVYANVKGASQVNLNTGWLSKFEVALPDIVVQEDIVKKLDKCASVINKRKQELEELDNLIKSQFVEMFGDPDVNEKGWKMNTFGDICTVRQGLQIPISKRLMQYEEDCYEYITVAYLHGGKEREYIKSPKATVVCTKDDVLMTRTGNTGMVITGVEGVFHNNFFLIDFDRTKYDKEFLVQYLNLDMIQADIIRRAGTSTIPDLNHGEFYKIKIFEPPINLQTEFNAFVHQVTKLKFEVQKSLDETQTLMDSLMQQYFG